MFIVFWNSESQYPTTPRIAILKRARRPNEASRDDISGTRA